MQCFVQDVINVIPEKINLIWEVLKCLPGLLKLSMLVADNSR
jgi:hypothetical protein